MRRNCFGLLVGLTLVFGLGTGCKGCGGEESSSSAEEGGEGGGGDVGSVPQSGICERQLEADVVVIDYAYFYNRLGAMNQSGMIYALASDVEPLPNAGPDDPPYRLKAYKRARPLVLRMNEGDCLTINLTNNLQATPVASQPASRDVSLHIAGVELVGSIDSDGSWVGTNSDAGVAAPGESVSYTVYADQVGMFMLDSSVGDLGAFPASGAQQSEGLLGALTVQPKGAEYYRSQVTRADMELLTGGGKDVTPDGQPNITDWNQTYPSGPRSGLPILAMLQDQGGTKKLVHSDLTAIITGPNAGPFPAGQFPPNPAMPDREEPWREFVTIYHDALQADQAFKAFNEPVTLPGQSHSIDLSSTLTAGKDNFAINYGAGGIGAEILANRIGAGPMADCTECAYEEFFLSSWSVGDPAMPVDHPAGDNIPPEPALVQTGTDWQAGAQATKALYPDDPSNVHHSYLGDHVKFQVGHGGAQINHVHHQHAHQWLHTPDSTDSHYLDSQTIGPGSSYTLEMVYGGSGNANLTPGDSIFHCHFYPHFAAGMWGLWRVHDVFEWGTQLGSDGVACNDGNKGDPSCGGELARALPDGEIVAGTPIPGLVPLPTKAMAPMPGTVTLVQAGDEAGREVDASGAIAEGKSPGYPFYIPGRGAHRAPRPPMETVVDGGLPRNVVINSSINEAPPPTMTRWDWEKEVDKLVAQQLEEDGTPVEKLAIQFNAKNHPSYVTGSGTSAEFITNGLPAQPGAPYADPCMDFPSRQPAANASDPRVYKAADIQLDVQLTKSGWHYPQQRMIALDDDVAPFLNGNKPPEPLFFRAESGECIEYQLTNLVPALYDLDDFQVRTPTDILGQHIHLVKFDVTSSDGAANGFNYEDGSLSPQEVVERIQAINDGGGLLDLSGKPTPLTAQPHPYFGTSPKFTSQQKKEWLGAQTTVQRWFADPLLGKVRNSYTPYVTPPAPKDDQDRTLRTVFTHDHFGPSTHQQIGLYAGLLVEPANSQWWTPDGKTRLGTREGEPFDPSDPDKQYDWTLDGGPTTWNANIIECTQGVDCTGDVPTDPTQVSDSGTYREFALLFQALQLAYDEGSISKRGVLAVNTQAPAGYETDPATGFGWADPDQALDPQGNGLATSDSGMTVCSGATPKCTTNADCVTGSTCNGSTCTCTGDAQCTGDQSCTSGVCTFIAPCPDLITGGGMGVSSMNYRAEPLPLRVQRPCTADSDCPTYWVCNGASHWCEYPQGQSCTAGDTLPGFTCSSGSWEVTPGTDVSNIPQPLDLSYAYASIERDDPKLNGQPKRYDPLVPGMGPYDPYTPLIRAYEDDQVQIRMLVGAHIATKYASVNGVSWLPEPSYLDSGFRGSQAMSLSEHFELLFRLPNHDGDADYLYAADNNIFRGQESGLWGLMRAHASVQPDLATLPNNQTIGGAPVAVCPANATPRTLYVKAIAEPIVYNDRTETVFCTSDGDCGASCPAGETCSESDVTPINDSQGIRWVETDASGAPLRAAQEPLVLRANAGDCIEVQLTNDIPTDQPFNSQGWNNAALFFQPGLQIELATSFEVGLHPQLVTYDVTDSDGANVGNNVGVKSQTVGPAQGSNQITYTWYAGHVRMEGGEPKHVPVEFGASNLFASDPLTQHTHGMIGALIIEPEGSTWTVDPDLGSQAARVKDGAGNILFEEFVVIMSDDLATGKDAINYGSEPTSSRFGSSTSLSNIANLEQAYADDLVGQGPDTPVFAAELGKQVRFRVLQNAGVGDHIFVVHGHNWPERPYGQSSTVITTQGLSDGRGARMGVGPSTHYDIVIDAAGGDAEVEGDYLYRAFEQAGTEAGLWGIMCVRRDISECAAVRGEPTPPARLEELADAPAQQFVRPGGTRPEDARFQRPAK